MDRYELVDEAHRQFQSTLSTVSDDQWRLPTPCEEWCVQDLVNHVVVEAQGYQALLRGCSADEFQAAMDSHVPLDHLVEACGREDQALLEAVREPGALDAVCHHYIWDMTGDELLGLRLSEATVHHWDLLRATGANDALDERLVQESWMVIQPVMRRAVDAGFVPTDRLNVDDAWSLQERLLRMMGRHP